MAAIIWSFLTAVTVAILLTSTSVSSEETDWTLKCSRCKCVWSDGRRFANCTAAQLSTIPKNLSMEIREIDFSFNPLHELRSRAFSDADLINIHKVRLQNCKIETVHYLAFDQLELLIELDLSNNNIKKLDKFVFRSNMKLRTLSLANNELTVLEDQMFTNMTHLQKIYFDHNRLTSLSGDLFGVGCPLMHIGLRNNSLTTMRGEFLDNFHRLSSIDLSGNPWHCDCKLQGFRHLAVEKNLLTDTPVCETPERLKERRWSDTSITFACEPTILDPIPNSKLRMDVFTNHTIPCRYKGEPQPSIVWYHSNRPIDTQRNAQKYTVTTTNEEPFWYNITILGVNHRDKGDYKCVATNDAGSIESIVGVEVFEYGSVGGMIPVSPKSSAFLWVILLTVFVVLVIVGLVLLLCCLCKRKQRRNHHHNGGLSKNNLSRSSEMMSFDARAADGKALITNVNPVSKPPRQYSVPASVTSGGTEVSEAKKMLIDDESCMGDDESRSFDYDPRGRPLHPHPNHHHLDLDTHYPPDLLSVPMHHHHHRTASIPGAQVSPAASSASTVPDTSRLPPPSSQQQLQLQQLQQQQQMQQPLFLPASNNSGMLSPMHSPLYDTVSLMRYGTLPYSRSHSPFSSSVSTTGGSGAQVRVPRHGYVTIPRKPRSSWSSEPPGGLPEITEPLYDNLGLRTTATGSSVLSLNKAGTGGGETPTTPRGTTPRGALMPQSPTSVPCAPIVEHDSPPTGAVSAATLPRVASAALSPARGYGQRGSWARSPDCDSRRDSTASLLPSSEGRPTPKVPPKPPPKPKKKTAASTALFEDEGEDGTEV